MEYRRERFALQQAAVLWSGWDECVTVYSGGEPMAERVTIQQWAAKSPHEDLGCVFGAIAGAAAKIAGKIRVAGLDGIYGAAGATNVQGEQQQKLDVFANEVMIDALRQCSNVAGVVSEENDEPVVFVDHKNAPGEHFVLSFDPLDGSSNIDVNVNVGTIFGIRWVHEESENLKAAVMRPGSEQVAAGYVVYGPSVVFVATTGEGIAAFTLDDDGVFIQSGDHMRMPEQGIYYSANQSTEEGWPEGFTEFIPALLRGELGGKAYSARYIGSLVADFHRTLLKGGVFLYPATEKSPDGKLRLQYEANPLAMIAEAAGGMAVNGTERILEIQAKGIHDRTPLVVGSKREVELLTRLVREAR